MPTPVPSPRPDPAAPRRGIRPGAPALRLWPRAVLLLVAAVFAAGAAGQIPGLPKLTEDAKPEETRAAPPPETLEQARARLNAQLDEARALRDRLDGDAAASVPDGATAEEVSAARQAVGTFVFALEGQVRALNEIDAARKARADAEAANRQWPGFPEKPPYSVVQSEASREEVESLRTKIRALETGQSIGERELERFQADAKRAEAASRLARETAASTIGAPAVLANWRVEMAQLNARSAAALAVMTQAHLDTSRERIAAERERLALAQRKLDILLANTSFNAADLERVRQVERDRAAQIERDQADATKRAIAASREAEQAAKALEAVRASPVKSDDRIAAAEARVRAADAAVVTSRFETDVLQGLSSVARAAPDMWAMLFEALTGTDANKRRDAAARLRSVQDRLKPWREYANSQTEIIRSVQLEQAVRVAQAEAGTDVMKYERAIQDSLRQRAASAALLGESAARIERAIARWLADIAAKDAAQPWTGRAAGYWADAAGFTRKAWNFEMFEVEETVVADGQKITVSRGVTVGKSVGALLLFLLGYCVVAWLARRVEGFLVARFAIGRAQARTVRRWLVALSAFALLMATLNLARIPIAVFAFMGGALAIGIGFGTQTIIKNFISGMIVLMERQVRVGDTIEVDGMTGAVTEVNLRSSTLRGFDGVEAIIPNSTLLEQRVTNWTRSDRVVRRIVKVGVAYGSPTREVATIMKECADRHGLVLKQPEPLVLLEDFGDNALVFGLYIWIDIQPGVNTSLVMSDLRFMLEKRLAEAGIEMAFPQRDLHFDAARPLRIELQRAATAPPSPGAGS